MNVFVKKYVKQGFCVFPLPYKSKVPFAGWNWKVLQTRKPSQAELEAWFQHRVNIAIVTGRVSEGLAVLDFDDMTVFPAWFDKARLESATVVTGRGCHIYVRIVEPESLHNGNFQVDGVHAGQIRFDGGYVVAPPSVHPSGKAYQFIDDFSVSPVLQVKVKDLHIEQAEQVTKKGLAKKTEASTNVDMTRKTLQYSQGRVVHPEQYAREALRREAEQVARSTQGARNNVLFRAALKTWKHVSVLGVENVVQELSAAALTSGLSEQESTATIKKAWKYGRY